MSTSAASASARHPGSPQEEVGTTKYSALIPVFNSADVVGQTIDLTTAFFERHGLKYEIILVNDGSRDGSWGVLKRKAQENGNVTAINLLKNYGQHVAYLCGLRNATGDYVITLDDDLQNPPGEMIHLIEKARLGHDVVFGKFERKRHSLARRIGSKAISFVNRRIFGQPKGLVVSNFRILRRDVVDRICNYQAHYPYITGLALLFSNNPSHVTVEHRERSIGKSNYNLGRIAKLVVTILLSYSSLPLQLSASIGFTVALASFVLGAFFLGRRLFLGTEVPGWTTLVVLLAFFNGVTTLMLSMMGEYLMRILNQISVSRPYEVVDRVSSDG